MTSEHFGCTLQGVSKSSGKVAKKDVVTTPTFRLRSDTSQTEFRAAGKAGSPLVEDVLTSVG